MTGQVFNEGITSNWRREALSGGEDFSERMADWCIAELQYKAKVFEETGAVSVFTGDVVKSDTAIPATIQEELKATVKLLEDVPEKLKDWHPDSDEKFSISFPRRSSLLYYGTTRILPDSLTNLDDCIERCGEATVLSLHLFSQMRPGFGPVQQEIPMAAVRRRHLKRRWCKVRFFILDAELAT